MSALGLIPAPAARAQTPLPPAQATAGSATVHHYEYVFAPGEMYVYDIDAGQQLVQHVTGLPDADGPRGEMVDPATHTLYVSHGGDGPIGSFNGSLLAYDLVSEAVRWKRSYPFPIDSGAITPDGRTIYMPTGENEPSGIWNVLDASNGEPIGSIQGPANAHNTVASLDGRYMFMGGRESNYLEVASTATNTVIRKIGPLVSGVRPFTVNGTDTLAYTTATGYLGFQVSSIQTGRVLYTVPIPGFGIPSSFHLGPPSHGVTLTPDEQQLYVMDAANDYVHVFDVSKVPAHAPTPLANIPLSSIAGNESPCVYDCEKSGWLQASRDGRFVYVGDTGDVIDTETLKIVANIAPLAQTRQMLEIDWADGVPVASTSRYGLGYVTSPEGPPIEELPSEEPPKEESPKEGSPKEGPSSKESPIEGQSEKQLSPGVESHQGLVSGGGERPASVGGSLVGQLPGGLAQPAPSRPTDLAIQGLTLSPNAFSVGGGGGASSARAATPAGAEVRYTDSAPARTTFTVIALRPQDRAAAGACAGPSRRAGRRCLHRVLVGSFERLDRGGRNSFRFTGRIAGRGLRPGSYRLEASPAFAGHLGTADSAGFRVRG